MKKSNERLRHQLEVQSIQIEEFLTRHQVPAEVAGGTVRSSWISFDLNTQISAGLDKLRNLRHELAAALGSSDVSITHHDDRLRIAVKQPANHPVDLLDLMDALPEAAPLTATLGLDAVDRPVLLNLLADDIVNILVAGGPEAGKTALLRTLALSLALQNRQSHIQMAILDIAGEGKGRSQRPSLYPLNYLPHVMFTVVESLRDAAEALHFLVSEAEYRIEQEVTSPLLVVIIDDVDRLVELGGRPIAEPLTYLLEEGANAGMRLVLGASNPNTDALRPLLKNCMPVRLVGRVSDANEARAVTGMADSQAEYLMGQGDFIAVSNGMMLPFQAAFITEYDLHLILDRLHRQSQRVMIAQPLSVRPTLEAPEEESDQPQYFEFNSHERRAKLSSEAGPPIIDRALQVIEAAKRPPANKWHDEKLAEEAAWEEIDEDDEYWNEAEEPKVAGAVIDVWAGFQETAEAEEEEEETDWEAEENWEDEADDDEDQETDSPIEVWSRPKTTNSGFANHKTDSNTGLDEIEFDWN